MQRGGDSRRPSHPYLRQGPTERDACGVGFVVSRSGKPRRDILDHALRGLRAVEHRGGVLADGITGDGSGVMTDIPWALLGAEPGQCAVATIFLLCAPARRSGALEVFEETFGFYGLEVERYRRVPTSPAVLGDMAADTLPEILHAIIARPPYCRTDFSFEKRLHLAKQKTRTTLHQSGYSREFYFTSLSSQTTVYKAMCQSPTLERFYDDLREPTFTTRFALFHRRFSTNTKTSWDKVQPFRLIAHNGEINTINGNRSWSYAREQELGLPRDELLTHESVSDSGNFNEMAEALRYRSSIPAVQDVLSIMVPPAHTDNAYYRFWQRAVEPWDGPAFLAYCDGKAVGARLDRNGFRPGRWALTSDTFFLASEAGVYDLNEADIEGKGALRAGTGLHVQLSTGEILHRDPSVSHVNRGASLEANLRTLPAPQAEVESELSIADMHLFGLTQEERDRMLAPMMRDGLEPIGSMGDTAAPAILSSERRSFFDHFYQVFAQVTNPPLDYLREKYVTDLTATLGPRPNAFAPAQLIPPFPAISLETPVLDLEQLQAIKELGTVEGDLLRADVIDTTFARADGGAGMEEALRRIGAAAIQAVRNGASILILSDRKGTYSQLPLPSLLALRASIVALNKEGLRLRCAVVVDTGDVRNTHHLAALIGFGATAVCPRLAFQLAQSAPPRSVAKLSPEERTMGLRTALEVGLLKIMSKMGISVAQSYQGAKLFSIVGLSDSITKRYFAPLVSPIGGIDFEGLAKAMDAHTPREASDAPLPNTYQHREQSSGRSGERHSFTAAQAKVLHRYVQNEHAQDEDSGVAPWENFLSLRNKTAPVSIGDLLDYHTAKVEMSLDAVEPEAAILKRFGAGAMSFGAISGESQRDIFLAMRAVGGRSNSGEGGENPFYYTEHVSATTKQVASGRFGVTAEYLVTADEFEIKIAQGAKPGEGGQVMGIKVTEEIARARYASPGVDLISPAPLHDIYSIEDLRELIYQLRQLRPSARVCVKLVSGHNIGTIAAGVVKAGADSLQISGGNGGTGAASISSMKHAGLPWEIGLTEVHRTLVDVGLRNQVELRVDGGLSSAREIMIAAILGAEGFNFGKMLLGALGCIMARVCEKNTCPRGIATHDPKFKAKYQGRPEHAVRFMERVAADVRHALSVMGVRSLDDVIGQTRFLKARPEFRELIEERGIDLGFLLKGERYRHRPMQPVKTASVSAFNKDIMEAIDAAPKDAPIAISRTIRSTDRAALVRLAGDRAQKTARARKQGKAVSQPPVHLDLKGSAGQGFASFLTEGCSVRLEGEANDAIAKSMCGGQVTVVPSPASRFEPGENSIIGNGALYGATSGTLFVHGNAGDRFAVRNSGATAVVDGVGFHACEYMTGGTVVILQDAGPNIGAGMTGGQLYLPAKLSERVNERYMAMVELDETMTATLSEILGRYSEATQSCFAMTLLEAPERIQETFRCFLPQAVLALRQGQKTG